MKPTPHLISAEQEHRLNVAYDLVASISLGLVVVSLVACTGCVGYVDGGGGGGVVVAEPDLWLFGGGYYGHGGDAHGYSSRGASSRAVAHGGHGGHR